MFGEPVDPNPIYKINGYVFLLAFQMRVFGGVEIKLAEGCGSLDTEQVLLPGLNLFGEDFGGRT